MKLSNIPIVAAALIRLASARFEIDAVFYGGFYNCDVFGVTCTDLPENTCCAASQNGAREYHDGLFFHDASKAEGSINGTFCSRQGDNDCAVALSQIDYGICLGAEFIAGGAYTVNSPEHGYKAGPLGIRHPDSWYYRGGNKAYYIKFSSTKKARALQKVLKSRNFVLLDEFMTKNYDFAKPAVSGQL